jgi:hypothetical protein
MKKRSIQLRHLAASTRIRSGIAFVSVCVLVGLVASSLARTHKLPHRGQLRLRPQRLRQQPPRFQLLRRVALRAREVDRLLLRTRLRDFASQRGLSDVVAALPNQEAETVGDSAAQTDITEFPLSRPISVLESPLARCCEDDSGCDCHCIGDVGES